MKPFKNIYFYTIIIPILAYACSKEKLSTDTNQKIIALTNKNQQRDLCVDFNYNLDVFEGEWSCNTQNQIALK
ncbi:MAG: hypothetical protein HUU48_04370 [Flavobacteriales bacterium]|nr:hypothetical protein [Flavobacteriales bacterium]